MQPDAPDDACRRAADLAIVSQTTMQRLRLGVAGALLVGLLVVTSSQVDGRACVVGLSNEQHFETSQSVFLGQVVGQRAVSELGSSELETTFAVEAQWKGERAPRATVRTCGGAGLVICSEPFAFELGEWYVVFASGQPLRTTSCSLTTTREAGGAILQWLRDRQF